MGPEKKCTVKNFEIEIDFVSHLDLVDSLIGGFKWICPLCKKENIDYDQIWWYMMKNYKTIPECTCIQCNRSFLLKRKKRKHILTLIV